MVEFVMELYDALQEARASEEKARAAAQAMNAPLSVLETVRGDTSETKLETRSLRQEMSGFGQELTSMRGSLQIAIADIAVVKWQIGSIVALLLLLGLPSCG